jgi:Cft2 family RNA processing exonuclease
MQICIHRGSKEIGGSCVEVIFHGKRLIIDLGLATFMRELLRSSGGKVW